MSKEVVRPKALLTHGEIVAAAVSLADERGIGAVSTADVLVTAAVSNWGCTAIVAAMAARLGDRRILHTPEAERRLLDVMTAEGLINSPHGIVDDHVDGIEPAAHLAVTQLCATIVRDAIGSR